jgi:hypothetical protein
MKVMDKIVTKGEGAAISKTAELPSCQGTF